jgi:Protein of unknown function (DUF2934)
MNESAKLPGFEQRVRERAYALWEREGRPSGRDAEHWRASELASLAEISNTAPVKKAARPAGPPRRKAAAKKATPILHMSAGA